MEFNDDYRLYTKESPRQILFEDYKLDLPIKGGWGYSLDDACIIDKNDVAVIANEDVLIAALLELSIINQPRYVRIRLCQ